MVRRLVLLGVLLAKLYALYAYQVNISSGYRTDHLTWNIGMDYPDVLSELDWRSLQIWETRLLFRSSCDGPWEVEACAGGGPILNGRGRDSDYFASGRNWEFSRSYADTRGYVFDVNFLVGRSSSFCARRSLRITPQLGLGWNRQSVRDSNAVSVISCEFWEEHRVPEPFQQWCPFGEGRTVGTYEANWVMLLGGLRLQERVGPKLLWEATGRFNGGVFLGHGDWRLRRMVFHHAASAIGLEGQARLLWRWRPSMTLFFALYGSYFYAWDGLEVVICEEGAFLGPDLNEALWRSIGVSVGLHHKF